ncbi:MAG: MGMT family protein [Deltaproteobacteria bacterium]|nr:MGMT family protein [Deltaproteobacteria bacterium]
MTATFLYYEFVPSTVGVIGLIWKGDRDNAMVWEILLPRQGLAMEECIAAAAPGSEAASNSKIEHFCELLAGIIEGRSAEGTLEYLQMDRLSFFHRRSMEAALKIPLGMVAAYGVIARLAGAPGAARAVGTAMAENPFPLVLPCHRVVRSGGNIGKFGGGSSLKRLLLQKEGVRFADEETVERDCLWNGDCQ